MNEDSTLSYTDWEVMLPGEIRDRWPTDLCYGQVWAKLFKCRSLTPGRYSISGYEIRSDTVVIEIIDPAGTTEEAAAREFKEIMDIGLKRGGVTRQGHFDLLEQFVEKYPNSVYTPRALGELLAGTPVQVIKATQRLVIDYPRYSYAGEAIWKFNPDQTFLNRRSKAQESLNVMKTVYEFYPPTLRRIESVIKEME